MTKRTKTPASTRTAINILVVQQDATPVRGILMVETKGLPWASTNAWKLICEHAVSMAEEHDASDKQPVFLSEGDGTLGQYTVGELRRELVG